MRSLFALMLALGVLWIRPCSAWNREAPYDPATMNFPISPDQAAAAARQWAGDPALALNLQRVQWNDGIFHSEEYDFLTPDNCEFGVSCYTSWVDWWVDHPADDTVQGRHGVQPAPAELPIEQLQQAATNFARAHYPDFDALNMQGAIARANYFTFGTAIPGGGFFGGNSCQIVMDPVTGAVRRMLSHQAGPVTVPLVPTLTGAQAENVAFNSYAGYPLAVSVFTCEPTALEANMDGMGQQRLLWIVSTVVSDDPNMDYETWEAQDEGPGQTYDVGIDAFTGEIVWHEGFLGNDRSAKKPPADWRPRGKCFRRGKQRAHGPAPALDPPDATVLVSGRAIAPSIFYEPLARSGLDYWYAGYLRSPLWKMKVSRTGAALSVTTPDGRRFSFRDGDRRYSAGGAALTASAPPVRIHGRTYLPLDVWEKITGGRFEWREKERTLAITLAPKVAAAPAAP